MTTKNRISLIGFLGIDPELRELPEGRKVCNFTMATNERYEDKVTGEWKDSEPDWHRVAIWGKRGESAARLLKKGHQVGIEGRLSVRLYDKDGVRTPSIQVVADEVLYLERYEKREAALAEPVAAEDDLPF